MRRSPKFFPVTQLKLIVLSFFASLFLPCSAGAMEPWQAALAKMPLATNVTELNRTNCIPLLLQSFRENDAAKALIFMPGATDEFYFFHRASAALTNSSPTLLDALMALTNQTLLKIDFREGFVLVHSAEDPLEPLYTIEDETKVDRLLKKKFVKHALYNDRDWDYLLPILSFELNTKFLPGPNSYESNHFYRHSLAAWNLNDFEILEAVAMAGKTTFTVQKKKIIFEGDTRFRARPPVPKFPN